MSATPGTGLYRQAHRFADLTASYLLRGEIQGARRCLRLAERLFLYGNRELKNAVSNVFLFTLTQSMECRHLDIQRYLPAALRTEYCRQINSSAL